MLHWRQSFIALNDIGAVLTEKLCNVGYRFFPNQDVVIYKEHVNCSNIDLYILAFRKLWRYVDKEIKFYPYAVDYFENYNKILIISPEGGNTERFTFSHWQLSLTLSISYLTRLDSLNIYRPIGWFHELVAEAVKELLTRRTNNLIGVDIANFYLQNIEDQHTNWQIEGAELTTRFYIGDV